jgi:hypothetical protein
VAREAQDGITLVADRVHARSFGEEMVMTKDLRLAN